MSTKCQIRDSKEVFWLRSPWSGSLCHTSSYYFNVSHHHCPTSIFLWFGVGLGTYISGVKGAFGLFWGNPRRNSFQSLGAVSERYCVVWFQVCSALIPCFYVFRQYGEGKTHSYPKGLGVLQNACYGLTLSPFQGLDSAFIFSFEAFSSAVLANIPLKICTWILVFWKKKKVC